MAKLLHWNDTDTEWEKWGKQDPLFGVASFSKYRNNNNQQEFFETGKSHVLNLIERFRTLGIPLDTQGAVLDYGCGVGRVLSPLSDHFRYSVGIDISPSMLAYAQKQIDMTKVRLVHFNGEDLAQLLGNQRFSFIHVFIVLQHIRPKRGFCFLSQMLDRLEPNGRAMIQVPIAVRKEIKYQIKHRLNQIRKTHPIFFKLSKILMGRWQEIKDPIMQMNIYSPDRLLELFSKKGIQVRDIQMHYDQELMSASWYLTKNKSD